MATKYDTNPLDPNFPEKAKAEAEAETPTRTLPYSGAPTRKFVPPPMTKDQARKFVSNDFGGYSPPSNGQFAPASYQPISLGNNDQSITRKVSKVGLPENVMTAVPYVPWYLGMVASVLILLFLPKSEAKVRFHAAQGLAAHIAIMIVSTLLGVMAQFVNFASIGNGIFNVVTMVMLIIFMIKAWKGRPVHIETIDDLTNWLEEKITLKQ